MRKILLTLFCFFALFLTFPKEVYAEGEFAIDTSAEYKIQDSGKTLVTQTITIENLFSNIYATSYSLVLDNIDPQNPKAHLGSKELALTSHKEADKTTLDVNFNDAVVGKGKKTTFVVTFENSSFAVRTGEVWEVSIPKLGDTSFKSYDIALSIPDSFGSEAYISPNPTDFTKGEGVRRYLFDKETILKSPITAGFGAFQVFSFNLNYHLENPLPRSASVDIAIPPDTSLQRMYYQEISPKPENITVDSDGNWLARYILKPRERVDIKVSGQVQIFAGPRPFLPISDETLNTNLKESKYWQINDPKIQEIAKTLKTPKNIYDYVVKTLSYDYDRVKPNVTRFGALDALANPKNAICMEFTDLFIAIARASGIPAREVNGFAYTENPKIQPLSLVADVLHSWPEYWDSQKKTWVAVDPTWGKTTGGVDYFNKLDLRHFAFVMHGADPEKPFPPGSYKLGDNPQKDVFVSFGQLPEKKESQPKISIDSITTIPFVVNIINAKIENPGPSALYNLTVSVFFDDKNQTNTTIPSLLAESSEIIKVNVPFSFLARSTPSKVKISTSGADFEISTIKSQVLMYNLLVLFLLFLVVLVMTSFSLLRARFPSKEDDISAFNSSPNSKFRAFLNAVIILIRLRKTKIHGNTNSQTSQNPDTKEKI